MLDFTKLNSSDKKLMKVQKGVKFLDRMVKMVFYSTFLFAIITITIAWLKDWQELLIMLTEKWFDIMVREILVTGFIQIVKEITQAVTQYMLSRGDKEVNNGL